MPLEPTRARVVALAGGVGAARFLAGLVRAVPAGDVAVIVNTGDDMRFYGVHVSPDVDIVTYTLAGLVDRVEAQGGTLLLHSPRGAGTRLDAEIPCGS